MDQPFKAFPADVFIQSERELLRDQIAAAWQLHLERVEDELRKGWREHLASALERRFASFAARFGEEVERRAGSGAAALRAAHETAARAVRRIEQAPDAAAWRAALLDAAAQAAPRVMLCATLGGEIRFEGRRPARDPDVAAGVRAGLDSAPAFRQAVETLDTVAAMATGGELSEALAAAWGGETAGRVVLAPVTAGRATGQRHVAAVVVACAAGGEADLGLLELYCSVAGLALDCIRPAGDGGLLQISTAAPPPAVQPEEEIHARARRFARVRASEMRLYQPQAVREGRASGRLYLALKERMDSAREEFRRQFASAASMPDYFHQEVVRSLANDDEKLLGPEYPGPLCQPPGA
jgi:hypothetical protein